jgi:hypothetical protein
MYFKQFLSLKVLLSSSDRMHHLLYIFLFLLLNSSRDRRFKLWSKGMIGTFLALSYVRSRNKLLLNLQRTTVTQKQVIVAFYNYIYLI